MNILHFFSFLVSTRIIEYFSINGLHQPTLANRMEISKNTNEKREREREWERQPIISVGNLDNLTNR